MITLVYRAKVVGPVCRRIKALAPEEIEVVRDSRLPEASPIILRWGSEVTANARLEINSKEAISVARNKILSRQKLGDLSPKTWYLLQDIPEGVPVVIRPSKHHAGKHFYVKNTLADVSVTVRSLTRRKLGFYATELVQKAREFRVFVCQGYIVCVSERFPKTPESVAWNLAMGGRLINLKREEWPLSLLETSVEAAKRLKLDWCALDIAITPEQKVVVFEANTAPGLKNKYTLKQIATTFAWISKNGVPAPPKDKKTCSQHYLHPALREKKEKISQ